MGMLTLSKQADVTNQDIFFSVLGLFPPPLESILNIYQYSPGL